MPPERTFSPLTQLIALVMRIGRKCPEVQGDILEIMLLVSQIQAHVGIDHGYRHARRVIARVRNPRLGRSHPGGARRAPSGRERDLPLQLHPLVLP
jgi:hypothetical protein